MAEVKSLARLPQITSRMKRAMNLNVWPNKSGYGYQLRLPGFKYDDFDRSGYLSAMKVNRMMETARYWSEDNPKNASSNISSNAMFYVLGSNLSFSQELYRRASISLPMILNSRLAGIGRTSIDINQTLFDESLLPNGENIDQFKVPDSSWASAFLAQRVFRLVNLDAQTKRPVPIDEKLKQSLSKFLSEESSSSLHSDAVSSFPADVKLADKVPVNHYSCEITVRYDDLDGFFHTNQGLYLTYAAECAAGAALGGTLKNFSGDTAFRNIRKMTNLYMAETLPGDRLTVSTWEDTEDPCALNFVIRKDGSTVFRSKFVYFPAVND